MTTAPLTPTADPGAAAVAAVAARYDNDLGDLVRSSVARLAWRRARSGKTCTGCDAFLPLSAFGRDAARTDALRPYCRPCMAAQARARRAARKGGAS